MAGKRRQNPFLNSIQGNITMEKKRILVVEDEKIVAEDIVKTLEDFGYIISGTVSSHKEALQCLEKKAPDLILMDIVLQGKVNGIETANEARTRFNIPVVFLTAYDDKKTFERAKITEPYGYIIKPFNPRELHLVIEIALYRAQMEKRLNYSNVALQVIQGVNQLITREKNPDKLIHGICEKITDSIIYKHALIVLVGESGKPFSHAEAGLGKSFSPVEKELKQGRLPDFARKILFQPETLTIDGKSYPDYPLSKEHATQKMLAIRLESHGRIYGLISAAVPQELVPFHKEVLMFDELAKETALALHYMEIEAERSRTETTLRNSEDRLRILFEFAPDGYWLFDMNGKFIDGNRAAENFTVYKMEKWSYREISSISRKKRNQTKTG
jgi:CheY-like chemotaxis protein